MPAAFAGARRSPESSWSCRPSSTRPTPGAGRRPRLPCLPCWNRRCCSTGARRENRPSRRLWRCGGRRGQTRGTRWRCAGLRRRWPFVVAALDRRFLLPVPQLHGDWGLNPRGDPCRGFRWGLARTHSAFLGLIPPCCRCYRCCTCRRCWGSGRLSREMRGRACSPAERTRLPVLRWATGPGEAGSNTRVIVEYIRVAAIFKAGVRTHGPTSREFRTCFGRASNAPKPSPPTCVHASISS